MKDVTSAAVGTNYSSTNANVAGVSAGGLVTARSSGTVLITARKDEVVAVKQVTVPSTIRVKDFAEKLKLPISKVIAELMKNGGLKLSVG